jgi:TRAP-type C4-dicarboxylate transport system permease small subunit
MNGVGKFVVGLNQTIKYILFSLLTVLIIAVFAQVVFRFVINQPLAWTEELARYCLVWITFLGAAYAMSHKAHVGLDLFKNSLPLKGQKLLSILAALVSSSFFVIMTVKGLELMGKSMTQLSPVLQIPMGVIYAVMPISALILIINVLGITVEELKGEKQS